MSQPDNRVPKEAAPATLKHNRSTLATLPFEDTQDFEDAKRGFIASLPEVEIKNERGQVAWSLRDYAFLGREEAPPTVNPSLWRQARLNLHNGLFRVTDSGAAFSRRRDLTRPRVDSLDHSLRARSAQMRGGNSAMGKNRDDLPGGYSHKSAPTFNPATGSPPRRWASTILATSPT